MMAPVSGEGHDQGWVRLMGGGGGGGLRPGRRISL